MDEETDVRVGVMFADEFGEEEEMVILDPDEVSGLVDGFESVGVGFVGHVIGFEVGVVRGDFVGYVLPKEVMEEGPERWVSARRVSNACLTERERMHALVLQ